MQLLSFQGVATPTGRPCYNATASAPSWPEVPTIGNNTVQHQPTRVAARQATLGLAPHLVLCCIAGEVRPQGEAVAHALVQVHPRRERLLCQGLRMTQHSASADLVWCVWCFGWWSCLSNEQQFMSEETRQLEWRHHTAQPYDTGSLEVHLAPALAVQQQVAITHPSMLSTLC